MGLNDTPSANRIHIGFFGRRNAGKSSVVNAVTGQDLAVVSDHKGTTTDPVTKAIELLPLGPVVIMDTPGYDDDEATLGRLRVNRTKRTLNRTDIAVLVVDAVEGMNDGDREMLRTFRSKEQPSLVVYNKADLIPVSDRREENGLYVSARTGEGIYELKERLGALAPKESTRRIIRDLLKPDDLVVLVTPIDEAAPKGRMILPQVQTIRDVLDGNAMCVVTKETQLAGLLASLGRKPAMVVTDSQVFKTVADITPKEIPLTSFSMLMARFKGFLDTAVDGVAALQDLKEGDSILIAEGCTHHRQCNDIGTVKIPNWIRQYTGNKVRIDTCSGAEFPEDVSKYKVVLSCGGCMLSEREMLYRMKCSLDQGVPFTNYGVVIAYIQGILPRALSLFPELLKKLDQ